MPIEPSSNSETAAERYAEGCVVAGKYRLERLLGEGGMGTVWLSRSLALDPEVAIKLIRPGLKAEDAAERLLKEARAAARIAHRAIVQVFDFGQTELGDPFIVMELLKGLTFNEVLERHVRINPVRAVQTLLPVVHGLASAHEQGIVHRDLKPENIFLATTHTKRTQPKIVDFGIAKLVGVGLNRHVTHDGSVLGSPGYMAPEQARGSCDVDHRANIWSICVVSYEAITGCPAFRGENYNALMCHASARRAFSAGRARRERAARAARRARGPFDDTPENAADRAPAFVVGRKTRDGGARTTLRIRLAHCTVDCGNSCVDTSADTSNCGSCGTICPARTRCPPVSLGRAGSSAVRATASAAINVSTCRPTHCIAMLATKYAPRPAAALPSVMTVSARSSATRVCPSATASASIHRRTRTTAAAAGRNATRTPFARTGSAFCSDVNPRAAVKRISPPARLPSYGTSLS